MKLLAVLLLGCVPLLAQWKVDRLVTQCDGSPSDAASYLLERKILAAQFSTCPVCCDEACEDLCGSTCVEYIHGPWLLIEQQAEPGGGLDVCFDWDAIPPFDEVWWIRVVALDWAGNRSEECP